MEPNQFVLGVTLLVMLALFCSYILYNLLMSLKDKINNEYYTFWYYFVWSVVLALFTIGILLSDYFR